MKRPQLTLLATALALSTASFSHADQLQYAVKVGQHIPYGSVYGKQYDKSHTIGFQVRSIGKNAYNYAGMSWGFHTAIAETDGDLRGFVEIEDGFDIAVIENKEASFLETYVFGDRPLDLSAQYDTFFRVGAGYNQLEVKSRICAQSNSRNCFSLPKTKGSGLMLVGGIGLKFMDNLEATLLYNRLNGKGSISYLTANVAYNF